MKLTFSFSTKTRAERHRTKAFRPPNSAPSAAPIKDEEHFDFPQNCWSCFSISLLFYPPL